MAKIRCTTFIDMTRGDLVELDDARGTTLTVTRGRLWLTQRRDPRDIVLGPGDTWTIEKNGLTLIEAQGDSALHLVGRGSRSAKVSRPRRHLLVERTLAWLGSWGAARFDRRAVPYV
jgi:hypothetical protein